jgi:hypothetical protein
MADKLEFKPSAALAKPLRAAVARIAQEIRTVREPGSGNDFGSYLDSFFADRLAASLSIAGKMADSAGVDLRDGLHDLQDAIATAYPDADSAKAYPRQVAATEKHINAALAARPKQD